MFHIYGNSIYSFYFREKKINNQKYKMFFSLEDLEKNINKSSDYKAIVTEKYGIPYIDIYFIGFIEEKNNIEKIKTYLESYILEWSESEGDGLYLDKSNQCVVFLRH